MSVIIDVSLPSVNELLDNMPIFSDLSSAEASILKSGIELLSSSPEAMILGQTLNQKINGLESLTQNFDTDTVTTPDTVNIRANIGAVSISASIPGLSTALTNTQSSPAEIALLTGRSVGSTTAPNEVLISNSPRSIKAGINIVTGISPDYASVVNSCVQPAYRTSAADAYRKISAQTGAIDTIISQLKSSVSNLSFSINSAVGNISVNFGILDNVALRADNYIERQIRETSNNDISSEEIADAVRSISNQDYRAAVETVRPYSTVDFPELENTIHAIPSSPATQIGRVDRTAPTDTSTQTPYVVGTNQSEWRGKNTDLSTYQFTAVGSQEELIAEFRQTRREITEFVLHWTANYIDQGHVGAREIHQVAINRTDFEFDGCSYHYIVKRNGTIERGRPVGIQGAHTLRGHNRYSIGISFVAGYNCASGTRNPNSYVGADSISTEQFQAFDQWARAFYQVYPAGQAFGHNDTDPGRKPDPGFDVPEYCRTKFAKRNIIAAAQGPLNSSQLAVTV